MGNPYSRQPTPTSVLFAILLARSRESKLRDSIINGSCPFISTAHRHASFSLQRLKICDHGPDPNDPCQPFTPRCRHGSDGLNKAERTRQGGRISRLEFGSALGRSGRHKGEEGHLPNGHPPQLPWQQVGHATRTGGGHDDGHGPPV